MVPAWCVLRVKRLLSDPWVLDFTIEIADFQSLIKYLKVKRKDLPRKTLAVDNLKPLDLEKKWSVMGALCALGLNWIFLCSICFFFKIWCQEQNRFEFL